jgi:hypothetical protein
MTVPTTTCPGTRRSDLRSYPSSIRLIALGWSWCGRQNCSTWFRLSAWDLHQRVRRFHWHWGRRDARCGSHPRRGPNDFLGLHCFVPLGSAGSGALKRRDGSAVVTARAFEGF